MISRWQRWDVGGAWVPQWSLFWGPFALLMILACTVLLPRSEAQATHQVALTWTLSTDDNSTNCTAMNPCSQNVYRALGACSATTTFGAPLANVSAGVLTFTDTAVQPGNTYCYAVTFVDGAGESPFSNLASAKVLPFPPTNLNPVPK